jgi:hypothetical protein
MEDFNELSALPSCCIDAAESAFRNRFPLEPPVERDWLRAHLLSTAQKWGKITQFSTRGVHIRSVPRRHFFDARTYAIACSNNHRVQIVLLGSRVYYLAWRLNIILSTFWKKKSLGVGNWELTSDTSEQWPQPIHIRQLRRALDVYMEDEFLSNEGFDDLKQFAAESLPEAGIFQIYIGDFALLFILLHEIHHVLQHGLGKVMRYKTVADAKGLSEKRRERWTAELSHDSNAAFMAFVSAAEIFQRVHKIPSEEAKMQAASLVLSGADLVLHILQFVEERQFGTVKLEDASLMREFAQHPPSQYRRDRLSHVAFDMVTGRPIEELWKGNVTDTWKFVSENIVSQMQLRDRLFSAYRQSY